MKPILSILCLFATIAVIGCGGATPELPATSGGTSTASQDEIQKQMEASMSKSAGKYKGSVPAPGGKQ